MYQEDEEERGLIQEEKPEPILDINKLVTEDNRDSNVAYASTKDPDKHAKDLDIAKKANVNPALVEEDQEFVEQKAKQNFEAR